MKYVSKFNIDGEEISIRDRELLLNSLNIANVVDFGAIGDGEHDDTEAFNAAINSGKHTIIVPEGNYLISDTLTLPTPCELIGADKYNSTILLRNDSFVNITKGRITNLGFNGENSNNNFLITAHRDRVWIDNCKVVGKYGIDINSNYGKVIDCTLSSVQDLNGIGIRTSAEDDSIEIRG